jgi:putative protease
LLIQKNKLSVGDKIEILTPKKTGISATVGALYNEEGERIESAPHAQMKFYMETEHELKEGDIIRSAG